jgi:hypothetical protein
MVRASCWILNPLQEMMIELELGYSIEDHTLHIHLLSSHRARMRSMGMGVQNSLPGKGLHGSHVTLRTVRRYPTTLSTYSRSQANCTASTNQTAQHSKVPEHLQKWYKTGTGYFYTLIDLLYIYILLSKIKGCCSYILEVYRKMAGLTFGVPTRYCRASAISWSRMRGHQPECER